MPEKIRVVVPHRTEDRDLLNIHLCCHRAFSDDVEIKVASTDHGNYSRACNLGAEGHDGLIVLLNDDTVPGPGWIDELRRDIQALDEQGVKWGLLGARCDVLSGPQQTDSPFPRNVIQRWPRIVTGAAAIRSEAFNSAGGFDERFPFWYSDDALSKRLELAGYLNMVGTWYMRHFGTVSTGRIGLDLEAHRDEYQPLFEQWYGAWDRDLVPA